MILVLRMVRRVVKQSKLKESGFKSTLEFNNAVIVAHCVLIGVYTFLSIVYINVELTNTADNVTVTFRWDSAWTFLGAVADLFISCTLWIVTDQNQTPVAFRQANKVYKVLDILRPTSSLINSEFDETQGSSSSLLRRSTISRNSDIGDRLIA